VWQGVEVCCWYHESGLGFSAVFFCAALLLVRFNLSGGILSVPHSIKNFQMLSFRACSILNEWGIWHIPMSYCTPKALYNYVRDLSSTTTSVHHPLGWCDGSHSTAQHTPAIGGEESISSASLDVHWKSMISVYLYMLQYLATVLLIYSCN